MLDAGFARRPMRTGKDGYALVLTTQARLLDTRSHAVLDQIEHARRSEAHTAEEWLQDNAASFVRAVDTLIQGNARDIVLEFFRLYHPPTPPEPDAEVGRVVPYHVLKPVYPKPRRGGVDLREIVSRRYAKGWGGFDVVPVDELQPTLRWEAFPRQADRPGKAEEARHFANVSYEVSVFRAIFTKDDFYYAGGHYVAGPRVYARKGLTEPWHRIEEPLRPCARYAWTVRARFELDGQTRVTEWTVSAYAPRNQRRSPGPTEVDASEYYFLFSAPPVAGSASCADQDTSE